MAPFNLDEILKMFRESQMMGNGSMNPPQQSPNMGVSPEMMGGGPMQPPVTPPFVPDTRYQDMFGQQIGNMPQRETPGMIPRIFAGAAGLGSLSGAQNIQPLQDEILYGRYNRDLRDWGGKTAAALDAANLERQTNVLAKSAYDDVLGRNIQQQRADEYIRRGDTAIKEQEAKERDRDARAMLEQRKVEIMDFNARNAGQYTWKTMQDGKIWGLHNKGGKPLETGLTPQELSPIQKKQLELDLIGARADAQQETNQAAEEGRRETASMPTTVTTETTGPTGKTNTVRTTERGNVPGQGGPARKKGSPSPNTTRMLGPDGKTYWIPLDKVDDAQEKYQMRFP